MDIASAQALAAQQAMLQQQLGVTMLRQAAAADQQAVALLTAATQPATPAAPPANGRGMLVDLSV